MDRLAERRARVARSYPESWARLIAEWSSPGPEDRAWLTYSANYLFRTGGVRWALDPLTLPSRLPQAAPADAARDLAPLSFIVLTHRHADHLDLGLVRLLSGLPLRWVAPEFLLEKLAAAGLRRDRVLVACPLEPLEVEGVHLTPFDGLHWQDDPTQPDGRRGVPALGYLAEFSGRRWLFPGDTRSYQAEKLPSFGPIDGLFAHLWLGRGAARQTPPPLLEAFCRFCIDLQPRRVVITHLEEFGRKAEDCWDLEHARRAADRLGELAPALTVTIALTGESLPL